MEITANELSMLANLTKASRGEAGRWEGSGDKFISWLKDSRHLHKDNVGSLVQVFTYLKRPLPLMLTGYLAKYPHAMALEKFHYIAMTPQERQAVGSSGVRNVYIPPEEPRHQVHNQQEIIPVPHGPVLPKIPSNYVSPTCETHTIDEKDLCEICYNGPSVIIWSCAHSTCVPCYRSLAGKVCAECRQQPESFTFVRKEFVKI